MRERETACGCVQLCKDRVVELYCHYALLRTDSNFEGKSARRGGAEFVDSSRLQVSAREADTLL